MKQLATIILTALIALAGNACESIQAANLSITPSGKNTAPTFSAGVVFRHPVKAQK